MVHVIIEDKGMNRVLVRSIIDDTLPLGNFAQKGAIGAPGFNLAGAQAVGGKLELRGTFGNDVATMTFNVDPDKGVGPDGIVQLLPTPIECRYSPTGERRSRIIPTSKCSVETYWSCIDFASAMALRMTD